MLFGGMMLFALGPVGAEEAAPPALRAIPDAEQQQIAQLAEPRQVAAEVLLWLAQRGYSVQDLTTLLDYAAKFNRRLGEVVAIKKFTGWTQEGALEEVRTVFTHAQQWAEGDEQLWLHADRPWSWDEVNHLLTRQQQGKTDLLTLLDFRRLMSWQDLDTALAYAQQYGRTVGELYNLSRQWPWEEVKALLDNEAAWKVPRDTLLKLRVEFNWNDLAQIQTLATQHNLPFERVAELRRKERHDTLTALLALAAEQKQPPERILELYAQTRDVNEVTNLYRNAAAWKWPVEQLLQARQRMNWTRLTQAQTLATNYGLPFAEVVQLCQGRDLDEVTALLANAKAWNLNYRLLLSLRRWLNWTDLGQAVAQAQKAGRPLGEVLALAKFPGPPPAAALEEVPQTLAQFDQWSDAAKQIWPLTNVPLEWTEVQNVLARLAQGKIDLATLLTLRQEWGWKDVDQILAYAEQYHQPAARVAELGRTREWGEVNTILQNAQQWGVDVDSILTWRQEFGWDDLTNALQNAEKFKAPREKLLEARRAHEWNNLVALLGLSQQFGQPLEKLLELHQTRDPGEITNLLTNAQGWKVDLAELVQFRRELTWTDLAQLQTLATQYALPLGTLAALRRTHNFDELNTALQNAKNWNLDYQLLLQLRTWLVWADIQQAVALADKYKVPLENVIAKRKTGQAWNEIEADLQPKP